MRQFVAAIAVAWCVGVVAQNHKQADGIDIVFLIDDSRSMERNDPTEMRKVALKAFLDLTQETGGDRIAVLRFAGWEPKGKPFLVYPLTQIPRDPKKRTETLKAIKKAIEEKVTASGMATDFNYAFSVALTEAIRPWLKTNRPLWIVLFTDGQMAPGLLPLKQRLGKEFPVFYKPAEQAIMILKDAYEKARAGVDDFANLEFARKELKKRHLALRRTAEDLFGRLVARQAKTLFKGRKVVVSMVYLRSAAAKQQIRTPSDLQKSNAVANHLVQHLGAKLHLVGRRRLKSVFFDILKDVSDFWKPGLLRCYKDISVGLKPDEVRNIPMHIFQGTAVTKVILFGRSAEFEPRLFRGKEAVKGVQVAGIGERYRILTLRGLPFGDYTLQIRSKTKESMVVDVVAYAQVELQWSVLSEQSKGGPLIAGGSFAFGIAPSGSQPDEAQAWLALSVADKKGNPLTDPHLTAAFNIKLTVPGAKEQPAPTRYTALMKRWMLIKGVGSLSEPGTSDVVVEAKVTAKTGGDNAITICQLPTIRFPLKIIAPLLRLSITPSMGDEFLEFEKLVVTGEIVAGKPAKEQAEGLTVRFASDKGQETAVTMRFSEGVFRGETRLAAGRWHLKGDMFDNAKVSNAEKVAFAVRERRLSVEPGRVVFRGFTKDKLKKAFTVTYEMADDEEAEAEIAGITAKRSCKVSAANQRFDIMREGTEIPLELMAETSEAAGDAATVEVKVRLKGVPQSEKTLKVPVVYEYVRRPFPWWMVAVGAAVVVFLIVLIWALTRPVFTEQQFWLRTENQYLLRNLGKRKAPATEQAPNSVLFVLKGSRKKPICHIKPISSEWTLVVNNERAERLVPLKHGSWITLVRGDEKLDYRYFDRQPTEWELLGVPYEPGEEYFLIIEEEP
ncbi:MAG: hypothetical protein DRP63_00760 [Planctomycetota bacterium]|nr:MAG: hypothetical protein DRP63_00760 [Planctomycetota bacterium]